MKPIVVAFALCLGWPACAPQGSPSPSGTTPKTESLNQPSSQPAEPRKLTLEDVAERVRARDSKTVILDSNPKEMFEQRHVPGARWVAYDAVSANDLPADRSAAVIFYCANPMCSASHRAAKAALALGWTNVAVMPDGIFGWVRAGLPVEAGRS